MIATTRARSVGADGRQPEQASLATRARLADGRTFAGSLSAQRHRRIQLGLLHSGSDGYVELAAGRRPPGGKLHITTRRDRGHFLPGGEAGDDGWLSVLLELAERHVGRGEEVFVAPAVRGERAASKTYVSYTNWLWIDVDGRDGLPAVRAVLRDKPAHLVIASGGSGGVHCYWRLREPLQADGDAIERAHERLIFALGYAWQNGRPTPTVADGACKDRSRIMRLAGTINGKSGEHARVVWADLALAPWRLDCLIGDLPAPPQPKVASRARPRASAHVNDEDPYKRIAPGEYFRALAHIEVPAHGLVSCPNPSHEDRTPSCSVGEDASKGWCCHGCGAGGSIYDLASVLLGGPIGRWLRGEQFRRARDHVREAYGDREAVPERYDASVPNGPTA